jgi:superoxide reductase
MTKLNQIYKCNVCGNIVEIVHEGAGGLVCCNEPMELQEENAVDAATEKSSDTKVMEDKHVPIVEKTDKGVLVKVSSVIHPMEEKHYIEWIEVIVNGKSYRQFLSPGDEPRAEFSVDGENITARAYCNLHGLWRS